MSSDDFIDILKFWLKSITKNENNEEEELVEE